MHRWQVRERALLSDVRYSQAKRLRAFGRYWHKADMPVQSPHVCRWRDPVAKVETCIPLSRAGELIRCVLASDEDGRP